MAFFDNISKSVAGFVSDAGNKAKDFSETTRLNGVIGEEERKQAGFYSQIGQKYVSLHGNDPEEALAGLVQAVAASEDRLNSLRKQVASIRGVRRCPACGAEVAASSIYCNSCGSPMPKEEAEPTTVCPNCGARVKQNMKFCTTCGGSLSGSVPGSAPGSEARKCPSCGTELRSGALFCPACGMRM